MNSDLKSAEPPTPPVATVPHKWAPVINDYCIGCGACVKACPHRCLEPIWDFATLVQPDKCTSCGACIPVCEHDAIHMQWVRMEGDGTVGQWCDKPPEPERKRRLVWPFSLFAKDRPNGAAAKIEHPPPNHRP